MHIDYQDREMHRCAVLRKMKDILIKFLVIGLIFAGIAIYVAVHPASMAAQNVANVDRREAAREAIMLYSEAHPEYTSEEVEEIFRNVVH